MPSWLVRLSNERMRSGPAIALLVLRWVLAGGLLVLAYRQVATAFSYGFGLAAAGTVLTGVALIILAVVLACPELVAVVTYPLTRVLGGLFYPERRFERVPEELLLTLRRKIAALQFPAAEHQLRGLLEAYGPEPRVYHLLAWSLAARGADPAPIFDEARGRLRRGQKLAFDRLVACEPIVRASVVIERTDVPGQSQRAVEDAPSAPIMPLAWTPSPLGPPELPSAVAATPADAVVREPEVPTPKLRLRRSRS